MNRIMDQIKAKITAGDLKENDALPSVRTLAKELKISALTVKKAYDNLEQERIYGHGSRQGKLCCRGEQREDERGTAQRS